MTVVMGVYNCADTLDEALGSLVRQTYKNWDLVVCDDASSDDTYPKLLQWQERLPGQITVLRNPVNAKLSYTLNKCLKHATGDLIARMDGDDLSMPDRFSRQVEYLKAHPEADLVGTAMQRFSAAGLADVLSVSETPDKFSLRSGSPFCHATVMCRRAVFETLNGYVDLQRTQRVEDLDLWFRFYAQGFVGHNLLEPLYLVREDLAAIRRRTLRNRLNVFRTTVTGYSMLGFPRRWYIFPLFQLTKAFVPARGTALYREMQKRRHTRKGDCMTVYYAVLVGIVCLGLMVQSLQAPASAEATMPRRREAVRRKQARFLAFLAGSVLALVGALRWRVGTDYWTYELLIGEYAKVPISEYGLLNEPGMKMLSRVGALITPDYALVLAAAAVITTGLTIRTTYRFSPYFGLSLVLFVLTGPWTTSFNAVRQYLACAIVFAGHGFILERRFVPYVFAIVAATIFHVSALLLILLYFVPRRRLTFVGAMTVLTCALLATLAYRYMGEIVTLFRGDLSVSQQGDSYFTEQVNLLRILAALAPVLFYAFVTSKSTLSKQDHFYVYMLLLNAAVMVASIGSAYVARLALYTGLFVCIALPRILRPESRVVRSLAILIMLPLYFAFWYIDTSQVPNLANFQWIFQR